MRPEDNLSNKIDRILYNILFETDSPEDFDDVTIIRNELSNYNQIENMKITSIKKIYNIIIQYMLTTDSPEEFDKARNIINNLQGKIEILEKDNCKEK